MKNLDETCGIWAVGVGRWAVCVRGRWAVGVGRWALGVERKRYIFTHLSGSIELSSRKYSNNDWYERRLLAILA